MKDTRLIMGMPVTIEAPEQNREAAERAFAYFTYVDETFSTYKPESEISRINRGELALVSASLDMREVFRLSEETKRVTNGFFNIQRADGTYDPSGLVKGWAISNAAGILKKEGLENFYVEAGGDIEVVGVNPKWEPWSIGIKHPFDQSKIVKVLSISNKGVATSGTYIRGQHIYNPHEYGKEITEIVSLTVVGPNCFEADRFATAAFAMGKQGLRFIEELEGFECYVIGANGMAVMTSGFEQYAKHVELR